MNYRPLPDSLTIKTSSIEGLGLFATKTIAKNTDLGMSHFLYGEANYYKRTHKRRKGCIRKKWGPKRAKPKKNRGQGH